MNTLFRHERQRGFTLIEIMVAIAIASFLMMVVMGMFSSTSRSRALQTALSGLNESGRFALSVLGRDLRMAGFKETDVMGGAMANAVVVAHGAVADGGDSITVRYEADKDCTYGDTVGGTAINTYALNMTDFTLECNGEPIVDDVEQMQIYLGEDLSGNGVANRYMTPDDGALDMDRVVSLRLNLLIRSGNDRETTAAQSYFYDGVTVTATDRRLRRQYSITVSLRNPI